MRKLRRALAAAAALAGLATLAADRPTPNPFEGTLSSLTYEGEKHLANVRQLTFGGENAEAYWSADGKKLIFQSTRPPYACDQIFEMDPSAPEKTTRLLSTGKGRTTCAYFFPDGKRILYASTHLGGDACPPPPDMSQGYVWALFPDYDIFSANADGSGAEAPDLDAGLRRRGHDLDGRQAHRLHVGPRRRPRALLDGRGRSERETAHEYGRLRRGRVLFRRRPVDRLPRPPPDGAEGDRELQGPARPLADQADDARDPRHAGRRDRRPPGHVERRGELRALLLPRRARPDPLLLERGGPSRPELRPLGRQHGRNGPRARSRSIPTFDGFPMFSPDGKRLAFCSNRHNAKAGETNVFVADWVR